MGLTSHWTGDDEPNWRLLDRLLAAIRTEYHPHDEVIYALIVCLAKTIVMTGEDPQIEIVVRLLRDQIDFQHISEE